MNFAEGVYLSKAQNPIPLPPPAHCTRVYSILILTVKGGKGES
jgi:hypothetical protein